MKIYLLQTDVLYDEQVFNSEYRKMPHYRQEKINRCYFRKDRNLYLGAGIVLQKGLLEMGIKPSETEIAFHVNGKPRLVGNKNVFFNLAHSGSYAVAAFSDVEVGCDIEKISAVGSDIAEKFFSVHEINYLESCAGESQKLEMFFRLWTLKESYMKLTGEGMSLPLNSFEIHFDNPIIVEQNRQKQPVAFHEFALDNYRIAACERIKETGYSDNVEMIPIVPE